MKRNIIILIWVLMALLFFTNGCINMRLEVDIDYPEHLFKASLEKINKIHAMDPKRQGKVSNLNALLYDGDDRKMIAFALPLKTVEKSLKDFDDHDYQVVQKYSKKYLRTKITDIKNLHQIGPGLLVEMNAGDENTHILIWLD